MPRKKQAATEPTAAPVAQRDTRPDDALIAEVVLLEDHVKKESAKFAEFLKPMKERVAAIESELMGRLNERGADSTKTDAGTAYISTIMNTKIEDREKILDFMMDEWEKWGADMIQVNVTKDAVRRYMDEHNGVLPPGLSISHFSRLNIRKS